MKSPRVASQPLRLAALAGLLTLSACSDPELTSSETIVDMTEAQFRERCDHRGGVVEVIPHCGGLNTCKGFSYDMTTDLLSEHTCKGAATCAGWNCKID